MIKENNMSKKIKNIPEIRIKHGWLLQNSVMNLREKIPELKHKKAPSKEKIERIISNRRKIWNKNEKKIIDGMKKITGLDFYANTIDVYMIFGLKGAFSDPLVINIGYEKNAFIDTLTHELIHRILTDNKLKTNGSFWTRKNFPKIKDNKALNHILVHAVHKAIYLDILKSPKRLKFDIEKCQKWPSYKLAWEIVEKKGYKNIISDFKKYCKQI